MPPQHIDTRLLEELTEQSQDLNSDAMRITNDALVGFGRTVEPVRRRWWHRGGPVAAAAGAFALLGAGRAFAASPSPSGSPAGSVTGSVTDDIMALQTAASIENLAVGVYRTAAGLPFVKDGNRTVAAFIAKTTEQHEAHAKAFNSAAARAGGQAQNGPDPKYRRLVDQMLPDIKGPADVVRLAITLEDVATQTYTRNVSQVSNAELRRLFASVAPVEAQHRATLLAVQALLAGNAADLVTIPVDPAKLPAAAGSVGFPDAFHRTDNASPISEGAVQ
ncbi:ferritin-like domain-containing protein [Kitasatospora sp. NPDC056327]|uniref:ferritin-like domain-containing protein n=1 Tax=Kitasatospora sp. NPDC056327 TaxID=3345785 RepID=UPI0035D9EFD1